MKRILVIDDTKNIRLMISKCLSSEGYEVDTADNGYDGISRFREKDYDIVILDIRMPELSGTEVLKILKGIRSNIDVIIITAFPTVKNAVDCIKMGAVDYLRKPFTPNKIKEVIDSLINRENVTSLDTDDYIQAMQYAKKCIKDGNFDDAIKFLRKAISISIEGSEAFILLGNIFEMKGDFPNSQKYYKIALQLEPDSDEIYESLKRVEG